ncbi:HEAT repeat domain-containing protein [Planctomycetaceae bacterium SH139]
MNGLNDENPFAILPRRPKPWRAIGRSLGLLLCCCLAVYGLHIASRGWLLSRLAHNLDQHAPAVQRERLAMLAEFGVDGLPVLVNCLAADDRRLAEQAYAEIQRMRGRWETGTSLNPTAANQALVASIAEAVPDLPPDRRSWLVDLLNATLVSTVDSEMPRDAETYRRAQRLLAVLAPTGSDAAQSALASRSQALDASDELQNDASENDARPRLATVGDVSGLPRRLQPLPTRFLGTLASDANRASADPDDETLGRFPTDPPTINESAERSSFADEARGAEGPGDIGGNFDDGTTDSSQPTAALLSVPTDVIALTAAAREAIGDNPLSAFDTRSVIYSINSVRPNLRAAAERELRSRGFTAGDLALAAQLVSPDASVRLSMISELPRRADVDPRQWLLWLAADTERDVRLEAISILGTMDDPAVKQALRELLKEERDTTVASRLRRVLGLR